MRAALLALLLTGCAQTVPLASAPADSGMSAAQAAIEAARK
jgi:hypothetical protein